MMHGQSEELRPAADSRPVRVIAVASGKGGVGKTNVSVNLATALAQMGRKAMIMDADLGLANVDVVLGLRPAYNLAHVLTGERSLQEIIVDAPGGIKIIPAASGLQRMAELSTMEHAGVIRAFSELSTELDVLIVDTAAGIAESVVSFSKAAQEMIVVVCDEPASVTDAYALIKLLNRDHGMRRFHILGNMARSPEEGRDLFQKMVRVTDRFLEEVVLDDLGTIPFDEQLRKAVKKQCAVVDLFPRSPAAAAFRTIAERIDGWPLPHARGGNLAFFVERLVLAGSAFPSTTEF